MITINTDEILFYELYRNAKKWELAKTEKITFSENPESYFLQKFYILIMKFGNILSTKIPVN
jgi:hypothetical protein